MNLDRASPQKVTKDYSNRYKSELAKSIVIKCTTKQLILPLKDVQKNIFFALHPRRIKFLKNTQKHTKCKGKKRVEKIISV